MSGIIPGAMRGSTVESITRTTTIIVLDGGIAIPDPQLSQLIVAPFSLYAVSMFLVATNNGTDDTDSLTLGFSPIPALYDSVGIPVDAYSAYQAIQQDLTTPSTARIYQDFSGIGGYSSPGMDVYGGGLFSILTQTFMFYTGSMSGSCEMTVSYVANNGGGSNATQCTVHPGSYISITRLA